MHSLTTSAGFCRRVLDALGGDLRWFVGRRVLDALLGLLVCRRVLGLVEKAWIWLLRI